MVYCVIPRELGRLHEPLRRHFVADSTVEVVVERRGLERRALAERRAGEAEPESSRRRIRNADGRRVADRRAPAIQLAETAALPRKARPYAHRIAWVERLEPTDEQVLDMDSARLVIRFQGGDRESFGELYLRYFDRVYSYLRVIFREDPSVVEDLTQQVFVKVLEALPRYERRRQPFRAWLFTVVRNQAMTHLRARHPEVLAPEALAQTRDSIEADEGSRETLSWLTDRELMMFVERLPIAQRQVLLLRYALDLPTSEIARILGREQPDVRMLESRALRFLQARLAALGRAPRHSSRSEWRRRPTQILVARRRRFALAR